MSGARRERSSTAGSIFFAVAKASALSRMADSALRLISKTGSAAWDIENGMGRSFGWGAGSYRHSKFKNEDGRDKPGHDDLVSIIWTSKAAVSGAATVP